jgi:hypothetical protein
MRGAGVGPGAGAGEEMIGHAIAEAKAQLNLTPPQQLLFDAAVMKSKAARVALRALHQNAKDALAGELLKTQPNLASLVPVAEGVQSDSLKIRRDTRDAWLTLYATLSPEQKAVIHALVAKRMARAEAFGERMRQHFLDMHGGSGG